MNKNIGIITLGCKVNQYESEALTKALRERGFNLCDAGEICDAYIINTCTVTAEADRKSRQMIRRAARTNPGAAIVVTGCTAEYSAKELSEIEGVIAVCGNAEKLKCVDILEKYFSSPDGSYPVVIIPPIGEACFEKMSIDAFPRTRVYIKIEDGCENKCAYCAIPKARGNVRSKLPEDILREVIGFVNTGCREIVLTGIETASYGKDLEGIKLGGLLKLVDAIAGDCKVRLGSLDPSLFKDRFIEDIKGLSSLAPHFHISLQSGSSNVLALMRRKYNAEGARAAMAKLRQAIPNVMFTTDIIVGFPGETEEDFEQTVEFIKKARFLMAHIFPYSEREGTPAAEMPNSVPVEIRRERAGKLTEVQISVRNTMLDEIVASEPIVNVLFETYSNGKAHGHTDNFLEVSVESQNDIHGQIHEVKLTSHENGVCHGNFVSEPVVEPKSTRKTGTVSGFRKSDDGYLERINNDLSLKAEIGELHVLQNLFDSVGRDPSVAELFFTLAGLRNAKKNAKRDIFIDSVDGIGKDAEELLCGLIRRYRPESPDSNIPPSLTALAEFAATGKTQHENCGIEISLIEEQKSPSVYSGRCETILTDKYAIALSSGKPLSGNKAGETCILLAPKATGDIEQFLSDASEICKRFLKEHPDTKIVPASERGLLNDVAPNFRGVLFDPALLPVPSSFPEAIYDMQLPAIMLFPNRKELTLLWKIAAEYGITPCAPAASRAKNIAVHSLEGNIELDPKILEKLKFSLPAKLCFDENAFIEKNDVIVRDISNGAYTVTLTDVGENDLYGDISCAMSDKGSVYAITGIIDPEDPAFIPALLTLDSYRRNNDRTVLYSKFFIGKKTALTVIKLSDKK